MLQKKSNLNIRIEEEGSQLQPSKRKQKSYEILLKGDMYFKNLIAMNNNILAEVKRYDQNEIDEEQDEEKKRETVKLNLIELNIFKQNWR